ncbi:MAG: hypothetical protein L0227_15070 [Chloroflexi bacterium]|nr:hypothetical protein [Chloroflexota bacterium]
MSRSLTKFDSTSAESEPAGDLAAASDGESALAIKLENVQITSYQIGAHDAPDAEDLAGEVDTTPEQVPEETAEAQP